MRGIVVDEHQGNVGVSTVRKGQNLTRMRCELEGLVVKIGTRSPTNMSEGVLGDRFFLEIALWAEQSYVTVRDVVGSCSYKSCVAELVNNSPFHETNTLYRKSVSDSLDFLEIELVSEFVNKIRLDWGQGQ